MEIDRIPLAFLPPHATDRLLFLSLPARLNLFRLVLILILACSVCKTMVKKTQIKQAVGITEVMKSDLEAKRHL